MRLGNAELHNVVEILKPGNENELTPSRIPDSLRVTLNPNAQDRATATPGCELRFNMESERVSVTLRCPEKAALAEVWYGPFAAGGQVVTEAPTTIEIEKPSAQAELLDRVARENSLAFDPALVRVILPYAQTRIVHQDAIPGDANGVFFVRDDGRPVDGAFRWQGNGVRAGTQPLLANDAPRRRRQAIRPDEHSDRADWQWIKRLLQ